MTRILLVEDHPVAATGLKVLVGSDSELQNQVEIVPWQYEQNLSNTESDIIFLSVNYQFGAHKRFTSMVSGSDENAKRLIVFCDESELSAGLRYFYMGASGLLCQDTEADEVLQCIKRVLAGKAYVCQLSIRKILDMFVANMLAGEGDPLSFILSPAEQEVIQLLLKGLTIKDVATQLNMKLTKASLLKANAFKKLRVRNIFELTNRVRAIFGK